MAVLISTHGATTALLLKFMRIEDNAALFALYFIAAGSMERCFNSESMRTSKKLLLLVLVIIEVRPAGTVEVCVCLQTHIYVCSCVPQCLFIHHISRMD